MKILLQFPEGFKRKALDIAEKLEGEGNEILISCETCYGACDLRDREAKALGCEKIIHLGHNKLIDSEVDVEYLERRENANPVPILEKEFNKISNYERFGLVSSLQFLDSLEKAKNFLESKGKKAIAAGQILGCDLEAAKAIESKIDCFLFVGSGKFHALGLALKTGKLVFILDMEKKKIERLEKEKFEKQRLVAVSIAKDADKFGVLISTKPGQMNLKKAEEIKKKLEKEGKKAYLLVFDEIKTEKLEGLDLDCFVNCACPRIAVEDRALFKKPLLNWDELF